VRAVTSSGSTAGNIRRAVGCGRVCDTARCRRFRWPAAAFATAGIHSSEKSTVQPAERNWDRLQRSELDAYRPRVQPLHDRVRLTASQPPFATAVELLGKQIRVAIAGCCRSGLVCCRSRPATTEVRHPPTRPAMPRHGQRGGDRIASTARRHRRSSSAARSNTRRHR